MSEETTIAEKETFSDKFIYPVLDHFFHSYLTERNIEKTLSLVTDDIYSLGTGVNEVAVNKEQFAVLLKQEIASIPTPIEYRILDYTEKQIGDDCWQFCCKMETSIEQDALQPTYYCTRLSGTFCRTHGKFLATSLHMSEASRSQDAMLDMMGYTYDEFVKDTDGLVINSIHKEDAERVSDQIFQSLEKGYSIKHRIRKKDGSYMWVYDIGRKITAEAARH